MHYSFFVVHTFWHSLSESFLLSLFAFLFIMVYPSLLYSTFHSFFCTSSFLHLLISFLSHTLLQYFLFTFHFLFTLFLCIPSSLLLLFATFFFSFFCSWFPFLLKHSSSCFLLFDILLFFLSLCLLYLFSLPTFSFLFLIHWSFISFIYIFITLFFFQHPAFFSIAFIFQNFYYTQLFLSLNLPSFLKSFSNLFIFGSICFMFLDLIMTCNICWAGSLLTIIVVCLFLS